MYVCMYIAFHRNATSYQKTFTYRYKIFFQVNAFTQLASWRGELCKGNIW